MADTASPDIPQTFESLMTALGHIPDAQKFETLICVWFNSPADGDVKTIAASYHSLDPAITLGKLAGKAGFSEDWGMVLIIGGRSVYGKPLSQVQVDDMISQVMQRLAQGGFSNHQDALFDRDGERINEIEFPAGFAD